MALESVIPQNWLDSLISLLPPSFVQASIVAKLVMGLLALASIWSWILIAEGIFSLWRLKHGMKRVTRGAESRLIEPIIDAGRDAAVISIPQEGVSEYRLRIIEAMNRCAQDFLSDAERGLPNLAVIASVVPFVGLFGTVFGIMTSFSHIAEAKDTSLAVVAPGIAEALSATAWGLAAAIPASVAYNRLGAALTRTGQKLGRLIEERAVEIVAKGKPSPLKEVA